MKRAWRWTAIVLIAALLILFAYGLITGTFVRAEFWLAYLSLVIIDWLVIRNIKKSSNQKR